MKYPGYYLLYKFSKRENITLFRIGIHWYANFFFVYLLLRNLIFLCSYAYFTKCLQISQGPFKKKNTKTKGSIPSTVNYLRVYQFIKLYNKRQHAIPAGFHNTQLLCLHIDMWSSLDQGYHMFCRFSGANTVKSSFYCPLTYSPSIQLKAYIS